MGASEQEHNVRTPGSARPDSGVRRRRHRGSSSRSSSSVSRRVLRAGYFALAAIWGCLAGTGVLIAGLSSLGRPLRLGPTLAGFLGLAMILAVVGGLLMAAAYRAASRRLR